VNAVRNLRWIGKHRMQMRKSTSRLIKRHQMCIRIHHRFERHGPAIRARNGELQIDWLPCA
jgi:hypothetical protein